ncbi:diguanylate cyclase/phosphodiesterase (GGDEF & EAL domains) with PAS/PAC sensor(s) [Dissulfuribacter thermophilus]|uniref:diguanylate cyclase n=1 Tax=Dissulfuribacter thermophilus TaxID=1156395 RepID=A0A1B9F8K3_9BACT|nr:diguanylate cyclase [Dissulfuribacter thermophilus]OCC16269.1 diguanylate cyclase/phosphodiesterase (GGDEF & EAL domains) with PAS/PAC sensor(s) [Dissulfuribacter thermophilus]
MVDLREDSERFAYEEKQSIIVVDDDPAILGIVGHFIDSINIPFKIAKDGVEALELMEQEHATIVITDLLMPRMDGMRLIREIKKRWPDTDIIVMTGYGKDFSYTDVISAGASDFIQKPFNFNELEAKLRRVIRERNLRATLKRLSIRDGLTDLFNRRYFEQKLEEEAERAYRQGYPLFLILVDLDKFKPVNDTYGHQEGDKILRNLAKILINSTRKYVDSAFRFGGDEFTLIIPQANLRQVQIIAERIRQNYLETDRKGTTLSIGISRFKRTNRKLRDDLYTLIHQADEAMYKAKELGGDRVIVHKSAMEASAQYDG